MADLFIFDSCVVSVYWQQSSSMGRGTWHYSFGRISLWSPDFHVYFCLFDYFLSLSLIKTFSFSCSSVHVTFRFTSLLSAVNFSFAFLDISIFSPLCFFLNDNLILASRFYICMELEAKPELLKHMQVYLELTSDGFFCCPTDKQTPV